MGFATNAIHVGQEPDSATGAIVAPESGVHVAPPFWEPRQRTAGVGGPDAAVVNVADWPA